MNSLLKKPGAAAIVGAFVWGIAMLLNLPNLAWPGVSISVLILAMYTIWMLNREIDAMKETSPNVRLEGTGSEVVTLNLQAKVGGERILIDTGDTIERFYVEFINHKKEGIKTEDAVGVYVNVDFISLECIPSQHSSDKPRWWKKYDPFNEDTWDTEVNIEASGKPEYLFLVLRKKNTATMYVFNQESHKSNNWRIPQLKLKSNEYYICISMSAKNMDVEKHWIHYKNLGRRNKPIFEILKDSPCEETKV